MMSEISDEDQSFDGSSQAGSMLSGRSRASNMSLRSKTTADTNPFKIPDDEKIFSFKDDERARKLAQREANKNRRVWEKNRPSREGCLRKLCETDIEPSALAINPKVQQKINVAEVNGFTIPIERPKNRENRYELIAKKREMF